MRTGKFLITSPSVSPENSFYDKAQKSVLCEGSTIDIQIVDAILHAFELCTNELGIEDSLASSVSTVRARLPPMAAHENQRFGLSPRMGYGL